MAKEKKKIEIVEEPVAIKEIPKTIFDKKFLDIGSIFSSLGGANRNNGENFVLIKNEEMKTTGSGILAVYKYDAPLNIKTEGFTPLDSKYLFSRDEGEINVKLSKSNIVVESGKRKSTIPLVTCEEWSRVEEMNEQVNFSLPNDSAIKRYIGFKPEDIVVKFKLFKEDIFNIQKFQGYFRHKANEEHFEISKIGEKLIIKISDDQSNSRSEEIEISEGIEVDQLKTNIKVIFNPKYLYNDDYIVTIYTNSKSGKKIIIEGANTKLMYFTAVEEVGEIEQIDDAMNKKLSEIDEEFDDSNLSEDEDLQDESELSEDDI